VSTTNPALLDTARLTINYPWSSQPVNPPSGYFQWTSRYSFGEVGGENQFGNQLVRLLPVNALNPGLGSERIVNAASSTVTFNFRFVADPTFGDKINNDVWFYLSESSTGYVRPWDTVEGTVFNVIANYTPPTVSVSLHPNSLAARLYAAGTVGARLADFQFTVTSTEGVEINSLHFTQNTINTASSSFMDYNLVYLTDISGNTVYGASVPTSTSVTINIAPGSVIVTSSLRLTLRADLSAIAANANVTVGGHRLGYSISDARHVTARGVLFNQPASVTLGQPLPNGDTHIMYKATPTVSSLTVSTTLTQGADLFKVRVSASGGDVSLYKFTFDIAPSGTQVIGLDFVDITDPNNESVLAQNAINQTGALFAAEVYFSNFGQEATVVPNHARTFVLRGTFANLSTGDTVSTRLAGDAAPTMLYALMLPAATVDLDPNDDFIWSDRHAFMTPHSTASDDWTNGYLVQGLPATQSQARTLTAL